MKQSSIIAILLTFLSLLLVLGAAVVFLFQARGNLRADVTRLENETNSLNLTLAEVQGTAAARDMTLATRESELATQEAQMATAVAVATGQQAALATSVAAEATGVAVQAASAAAQATGEAALQALEATRAAELAASAAAPPLVRIIAPENGAQVESTALTIVVGAGHPDGIGDLLLRVGRRPVTLSAGADDFRVFTHTTGALATGPLTVTATITSSNGVANSDSITVNVVNPRLPSNPDDEIGLVAPWLVAAMPSSRLAPLALP
jgi:hypothetical protein